MFGLIEVYLLPKGKDAYMTSCDDLGLAVPDEAVEGKQPGGNVQHGAGGAARVHWGRQQ